MKISLTTKDTLNIDIQLPNDSITHSSTQYDIACLTSELAAFLTQHFTILQSSLKQIEYSRIEQEKSASKKSRRFSNFSEDISSSQTPVVSFKQAVSLSIVQKNLEKDGLIMNSGLPEVVRFRHSPYAYTVKVNEWSSPFGSSGTEVNELLKDIAKNIYKMHELDILKFILKYGD